MRNFENGVYMSATKYGLLSKRTMKINFNNYFYMLRIIAPSLRDCLLTATI